MQVEITWSLVGDGLEQKDMSVQTCIMPIRNKQNVGLCNTFSLYVSLHIVEIFSMLTLLELFSLRAGKSG